MHIDVLTLFPSMFEVYLRSGIVGRAIEADLASVACTNFREFATDKHRSVDDRPFGGGPGMVLMCQPILDALASVESQRDGEPIRVLLTPQGERLTQPMSAELALAPWIVLICGRYEGFDDRIRQSASMREVSIGDYVLSGGEPAAMVLMDAMIRLIPGALGDDESAPNDSFSLDGLEYPQYTKPRDYRGLTVPDVLLSGHHGDIAKWRAQQSLARTADRRPDILPGGGAKGSGAADY